MRLIDELTLQRELFCRIQENAIDSGRVHFDSYKNWCLSGSEVEKAISDIFSQVKPFCPTIDPETLPIVRELREQLAKVTAERDTLAANSRPVVYGEWDSNDCCTNCGEEADYNWERGIHFYSDFCPNCGADMRGEKV